MGRAFASHQCGPGSKPSVNPIRELSLLLVLCLLREVFLQVLWFSPLLKNQHFQIPIRSGTHGHKELLRAPWVNKLQYFTYKIFKITICWFLYVVIWKLVHRLMLKSHRVLSFLLDSLTLTDMKSLFLPQSCLQLWLWLFTASFHHMWENKYHLTPENLPGKWLTNCILCFAWV